ncbi:MULTISPECIES: hypothetical protein [Brochothrix]|uniref:PspA/IM30 family protein n=1 Tax=Brochothrix thermosphacta TaxID=2756 RepID=A0A2X0RFY9_BROTH|nr:MULTISPECIES: hypothetical protein [Brochothrix]ANZ94676.1 hypothetical protein BFC19_04315 [Brochothrix thermosphacta]MBR5527233.1 hypothetical protein [Brochothrix sp.]MDO7864438.1 hypothetical protein [Brochothrix thermosphacta]ODJ51052.1 hypothetical protein BFR40_08235 [Brochothrix thermosphacta]ODJ55333.1 hypothetical protein BFR41_06290 [Brochothrix thermosphacta]
MRDVRKSVEDKARGLKKQVEASVNDVVRQGKQTWRKWQYDDMPQLESYDRYIRKVKRDLSDVDSIMAKKRDLALEVTELYNNAQSQLIKRTAQAAQAAKEGETRLADLANKEVAFYEIQVEKLEKLQAKMTEDLSVLEQRYYEIQVKWKDIEVERLEFVSDTTQERAEAKMGEVLHNLSWGSIEEAVQNVEKEELEEEVKEAETKDATTLDELMEQLEEKYPDAPKEETTKEETKD